jgi:hypothetical protein
MAMCVLHMQKKHRSTFASRLAEQDGQQAHRQLGIQYGRLVSDLHEDQTQQAGLKHPGKATSVVKHQRLYHQLLLFRCAFITACLQSSIFDFLVLQIRDEERHHHCNGTSAVAGWISHKTLGDLVKVTFRQQPHRRHTSLLVHEGNVLKHMLVNS